ncbi:MAG: pilus assembly protein PilM [bacterium]|uniref:Pilus assembly protein PilM n=1 Tax=Candidatus Methylomirabilis tolerans TaxID=3123416 RepID=A0AAJ1AM47_9BACT|nr:pilus assembly protein PilM [Candidatus Methylomirabilis sp.]
MFSWMTRQKELVGLDIGTSSVKAVHLQRTRNTYKVAELGIAPTHPGAIVDGIIIDDAAISSTIRQLFDKHSITIKDVAFSVSGNSVIVKKIKVPKMKKAELREGIAWEAEQHISYSIEDVNLDFQILREADPDEQDMDVLLVAVKKDVVNAYLAVIAAAGLSAAVIDVDVFAIENAFTLSRTCQSDEVVALVNVGGAVTNINILDGGISDFTRDSSLGGNRHTELLQQSAGLSFEQAEAIKRGESVGGHSFEEAKPAIEMANSELAGEIRRSFDFYYSTSQRSTIHRVVLSGGCALLPDLTSSLSNALELPVEIADPFQHVVTDPKKFDAQRLACIAPQMTVAVGLALREPDDDIR